MDRFRKGYEVNESRRMLTCSGSANGTSPKHRVGIFRLQLFKPSEGFIASQGDAMQAFEPIYIGRRLFGAPNGRAVAIPQAAGTLGRLALNARMLLAQDVRPLARLDGVTGLDIMHAHFAVDAVYALGLARRLKIPLITTLHGFDVTRSDIDMLRAGSPSLAHGVLKRRMLQRHGDVFICVSDFIRRKAVELGFPESRLVRHYIGIDCEKSLPRDGAGEPGLVVHVARLVEKKGTAYLLRAFAKIATPKNDARLIVIGDGPLRPELERLAGELGVAERCSFLGVKPNSVVLDWTTRASLQVVSSVRGADGDMEGLPIVTLEAGARGVPVVAFDSAGIGEAIRHERTGLLVPEKDVSSLAVAMQRLLDNPQMRIELGMQARAFVEQNFNIKIQTAMLEDIYRVALGKERRY